MTKEEMVAKQIQEAKSADEIVAIARENGGDMAMEEAQSVYDRLHHTGALSDEQLEKVAGGAADEELRIKFNLGNLKIDLNIPGL